MNAVIHRWVAGPLDASVENALARLATAGSAAHIAVMPDAHLAHDVCVGTVFAARARIYPAAVGGDIGCGMAAIAFDVEADVLSNETSAARLLTALYDQIPCLKQRRPSILPATLTDTPLSHPSLERQRSREGRYQFGTLGRGNHFLELQQDDEQRLWLMVHTGSRGMGVSIRDHHLRAAERDTATGLAFLPASSPSGQEYLHDHAWALRYAAANRQCIVDRVTAVLSGLFGVQAEEGSFLSCHHNHVRREVHGSAPWLVHRKGAISADDGEPGIIPGSMGTASFHTSGRGCAQALRSSSHGAGRAMSRSEARRRISVRTLRRQMRGVWYDQRLERRLLDEAPDAYRNIGAVMRAQKELTRIVRRLRPVLSFKGA